MKSSDFYCKRHILAWIHVDWAILRQNRLRGLTSRREPEKSQKVSDSHRNDVSPLTQGLRYRAACDVAKGSLYHSQDWHSFICCSIALFTPFQIFTYPHSGSFSLSQHNSSVCLLLSCRKYWPLSTAPNSRFYTSQYWYLEEATVLTSFPISVTLSGGLQYLLAYSDFFPYLGVIGKHLDWTVNNFT